MNPDSIHIAILAGGQSRRMGRDKALLHLEGQTLIERVIAAVRPLARSTFIVGDPATYAHLDLAIYPDQHPATGPIGGLYTALSLDLGPILLLACDLPFLAPDFLHFLVRKRGPYQVVAPRTNNGLEPLCALYEPCCLSTIESAIQCGQLSMRALLSQLNLHEVPTEDWQTYDEHGLLFANLNTPEEYHQAANIIRGKIL